MATDSPVLRRSERVFADDGKVYDVVLEEISRAEVTEESELLVAISAVVDATPSKRGADIAPIILDRLKAKGWKPPKIVSEAGAVKT